MQGRAGNINTDEDPSGWRPYFSFLEILQEKYAKNEGFAGMILFLIYVELLIRFQEMENVVVLIKDSLLLESKIMILAKTRHPLEVKRYIKLQLTSFSSNL